MAVEIFERGEDRKEAILLRILRNSEPLSWDEVASSAYEQDRELFSGGGGFFSFVFYLVGEGKIGFTRDRKLCDPNHPQCERGEDS